MITVPLGFQFQLDMQTHGLPFPSDIGNADQFIMTFDNSKAFYLYAMLLIDIRDRLEFEMINNRKLWKLPKLLFCKKLITTMQQVRSHMTMVAF